MSAMFTEGELAKAMAPNWFVWACGLAVMIVLVLLLWVFPSHMEAQAYNRVTGENVSTWDAMWIELRVQAGPKK